MPTNNSCDFTNPIGVSNGGTNASSMTTTDGVVYFDGTRLVTTTAGTSTQVLTSNGAGVAPTFQAAPTNLGWIKLSTKTASSSASIQFTSLISATYQTYVVVYNSVIDSAGGDLHMLISSNNGSTWVTTNYLSGLYYVLYNSPTITNTNATAFFLINTGLISYAGSGTIWLYNFGLSAQPQIVADSFSNSVATSYLVKTWGNNTTTANYNAIEFTSSSGNITSGTFTLYGVVQ